MRSDSQQLLAHFATCSSLFLRNIAEQHENGLRLLLEEASPRPGPEEFRFIAGIEFTGRLIEPNEQSRLFELHWQSYVAYNVRNESYAKADLEALHEGDLVRIYTRSAYRDYSAKTTFAGDTYPGPLTHIGIFAQSHILDVIAPELPTVTSIHGKQAGPQSSQ